MRYLEVWVNGRRLYAVGLPPPSTVSGHIRSRDRWPEDSPAVAEFHERVGLHFGGIDKSAGDYVCWPIQKLGVGDEVLIRVVEQPSADEPADRVANPQEKVEKRERELFEKLKRKYAQPDLPDVASGHRQASHASGPGEEAA